jgi:hypothetical protein
LRDSFQADQQEVWSRLRDTARATERSLEETRNVWLSSLVKLPDDEFRTLKRIHYPRFTEALRQKLAHEASTGNSVYLHG